jgi:polyhydroxyalkanoate synthase
MADSLPAPASTLPDPQADPALSAAAEPDALDAAVRRKSRAPGDPLPPSVFSPEVAKTLDRLFNSYMANFTAGLDPRVIPLAYLDWWVKLAWSPGTHARLSEKALRKLIRVALYTAQNLASAEPPPAIEPLPQDSRFRAPAWQAWPYNLMSQSFLLTQQWWANATTGVPALAKRHKDIVTFVTRQLLDVMSPANFPFTNPEVRDVTLREGGANLVRGWRNWLDDWSRLVSGQGPAGTERFQPGKEVAATAGKVVYRNHLIELIQYAPATASVYAEPLLIVPAWIMKYYILDLSPHNSLVKHLVDKGHTVFMISWRNPTSDDRELGMEDYRRMGIMAALDTIGHIQPQRRVHAVGYCLGGTLLTIAAAAMARDSDARLASITLLAAQTDFSEAGELMLFGTEEQVSFLESMMWNRGVLDTAQMAGAFQLLRSNDLIWSRMVRDYLLGERRPPNDLMAWNADQTRMPYRMHSEYLRKLFLNNDLAAGRYAVDGKCIAISDIQVPIFAIGTVKDHVAPWQSVYKINLLANSQEVTFLLTTGGHNAGIVSEPGHPGRSYQIRSRRGGQPYVDPLSWEQATPHHEGSWWPAWENWLADHSSKGSAPPRFGAPQAGYPALGDAPGSYVFQN